MLKDKLYDGKVTMKYDPIKHLYSASGLIVPSVTRVTGVIDKPALIYWAVNETIAFIKRIVRPGQQYTEAQLELIFKDAKGSRFRTSKKALNIGAEAHDWIERYIKSRLLDLPSPELPEYPPVLNAVNSYLAWESGVSLSYISSERRLYSRDHMFSGTVDIIMEIDGKVVVADLKTSKGIYPEYFIQCAAYAAAIAEEDKMHIDSVAVIRIPKDGGGVEIEFSDKIDDLFEVFKACLAVWRWKNDWDAKDPKWQS